MTAHSLVEELLAAWAAPFSTEYDHRHLLKLAADELKRLKTVIDTYALVAEASEREIRSLREAAGLPADGRSGPEAAPDTPDWDRPVYRTLGPSTWTDE